LAQASAPSSVPPWAGLAAEILYKHDLEVEAVIPALIASIIGYSVFGAWSGWNPIFVTHGSLAFTSPPQLLYYVVLGLLCGLIGLLYARGFYGITHRFHRMRLPNWVKPGIGGLLVGLIGLVLPQALGMGYGWVQVSMGPGLLSLPLWVILALPFAKILTTGLSIGSGGSGGIFGPGMVIGAMVGASVWRLCYHVLPGVPDTPGPFVIVGMMALFGGIAHAPLAVRQAMTPSPLQLSPQQSVEEAEQLLGEHTVGGASVLDARGNLLGVLTLADIGRVPLGERGSRRVEEAMNRDVLAIQPDDTLDVALEQLTSHRIGWMPVVEVETATGGRHLVGRISTQEIVRAYREALAKGSRRMRGLVEGTVMLEAEIEPGMRLAGRPLREAQLPTESLVVSIRRQNELLFPRGSTVIEPDDLVTFLVSPSGEERLRAYLAERVEQAEPILLH
jgi:CIC family chloride channel protein